MVDDLPTGALETIDAATSHAMSATMFVADFASTFQLPLGLLRPVSFRQLQKAITAEGQLDGREALWELYEGLMRFLLNVRPRFPFWCLVCMQDGRCSRQMLLC